MAGDYCEDYEDPFDRSMENDEIENEDRWVCEFPGECLMPSMLHTRDECYTVAMAEEHEREMLAESTV